MQLRRFVPCVAGLVAWLAGCEPNESTEATSQDVVIGLCQRDPVQSAATVVRVIGADGAEVSCGTT